MTGITAVARTPRAFSKVMYTFPAELMMHGTGVAVLGIMTVFAMLTASRLSALLAFVSGLMAYWFFLSLPEFFFGAALASLAVMELSIVSYAARRTGVWRLIR